MLERLGIGRILPGQILITKRQISNILFYGEMFDRIRSVDGCIVECGVGKGRSFLYLNHLAESEGKERRVWGCDSFEGFPEPAEADASARMPKSRES